jgi:pimeloyl-ACP methyl ester carboxylesterase
VQRKSNRRQDLWRVFDEDILLANGPRVKVPTGIAAFPKPGLRPPPRSLGETNYNIVHLTNLDRGGYFAALEQPDPLLADIRQFFEGRR